MDENLAKIRHDRSEKDFPFLKLEDDEWVEFAFARAKICYILIFGAIASGLVIMLFAFLMVLIGQPSIDASGRNFMYMLLVILFVMGVACGAVATMVFRGNRMFITNKHVVQLVMKAPFAKSVNIIDLPSVEDASFRQMGFLQTFFHYGTLRLSTVGDETTYTFPYADISPADLKAISKLITTAKEENKKNHVKWREDD
jgi:hypothetical protein